MCHEVRERSLSGNFVERKKLIWWAFRVCSLGALPKLKTLGKTILTQLEKEEAVNGFCPDYGQSGT